MTNSIVTLNINNDSIHVLVAKKRRIEKWGSAPLEDGVVKDGVVLQPQYLIESLKTLLQTMEIKDKNIITSVSGLHSIPRTVDVSSVPKNLGDDGIVQELKNEMPIPLEQLYLSWQSLSLRNSRQKNVFAVATPQEILDSTVQTMRQAGVKPYVMDLQPLALAEALNRKEGLIINMDPQSADIVIVHNGLPRTIHTFPFPHTTLTMEAVADHVARELDRAVNFYNTSYAEDAIDSSMTISLCGRLSDERNMIGMLRAKTGHPVELLDIPFKYPSGLPVRHYTANVGLALKKMRAMTSVRKLNLNLLPDVYRPKKVSLKKLGFAAVAITAVALLFPLYQATANATSTTRSLSNDLAQATFQSQLNNAIQNNITATSLLASKVEQEYQNITGKRGAKTENLEFITTAALIPGITVNATSFTADGSITLSGTALTYTMASDYFTALGTRYSTVLIKSLNATSDEDPTIAFSIEITP